MKLDMCRIECWTYQTALLQYVAWSYSTFAFPKWTCTTSNEYNITQGVNVRFKHLAIDHTPESSMYAHTHTPFCAGPKSLSQSPDMGGKHTEVQHGEASEHTQGGEGTTTHTRAQLLSNSTLKNAHRAANEHELDSLRRLEA